MNPSLLAQYSKAVCGAIVATCGVAGAAASDGHVTLAEGIFIAGTFFGTLGGVSAVKNILSPAQLAQQPLVAQAVPATNRAGVAPLGSNEAIRSAFTTSVDGPPSVKPLRDEHGRFIRKESTTE